jgi:hypothetical protein
MENGPPVGQEEAIKDGRLTVMPFQPQVALTLALLDSGVPMYSRTD